eukprot:UN02276
MGNGYVTKPNGKPPRFPAGTNAGEIRLVLNTDRGRLTMQWGCTSCYNDVP